MNGSSKARPKRPWGIILGQTDGVDLTTRLMGEREPAGTPEQARFLSGFFSTQISTFAEFAARDVSINKFWKIIETTGDGLIFAIHVNEEESREVVFRLYLQAMIAIRNRLQADRIHIRSVSHFCWPRDVVYGHQLDFDKMLPNELSDHLSFNPDLLGDELFGQDRIKLARLMAVAKGDFNILTQAFVTAFAGTADHEDMTTFLSKENKLFSGQEIDPNPIRLPLIRGFRKVTFEAPYRLWEMKDAACD